MAKMQKIDQLIPGRNIYFNGKSDGGQNWQMMLPLLHKHKCITLEIFLYNVLCRNASHSRGKHYKALERNISYEDILLNTIDRITTLEDAQKEKYKEIIRNKYRNGRLFIFLQDKRFEEAKTIMNQMKNNSKYLLFMYWFYHLPFADFMMRVYLKLKSIVSRT